MKTYDEIQSLEALLEEKDAYIAELEGRLKAQNARGAGRKRILSEADVQAIRQYRVQGCSYAEIAENYGVSVSTVYNYCR